MKIASISDLHLEHYSTKPSLGLTDEFLFNEAGADVLILAGDIMDSESIGTSRVGKVFECLSLSYRHIIYVMGNHEHYKGNFSKTQIRLEKFFEQYRNIYVLEKTGVTISGVRFFGGTMWTSFQGGDPNVMLRAGQAMNDYRTVDVDGYDWTNRLAPRIVLEDHLKFMSLLREDLDKHKNSNCVLVTHHSPSEQLIPPMFRGHYLTPLYHNNYDNLFYEFPQIVSAYCGHTHGRKRVTINNAELILNARGYPHEQGKTAFELAIKEI